MEEILTGLSVQLSSLQTSVNEKFDSIESRLTNLEKHPVTTNTAATTVNTDRPTCSGTGLTSERERAWLDYIEEHVSPDLYETQSAADVQRDWERLRESLTKIPVPTGFKVNDSTAGLKSEHRQVSKIISKCARYAEVGIKVLSSIKHDDSEVGINKAVIDSIFVGLAAQINFLQNEYAALVVKATFDEDTSRIFRQFENNTSNFSTSALHNIKVAAEIAALQNRNRPTQTRGWRGRGRGGRGRQQRFSDNSQYTHSYYNFRPSYQQGTATQAVHNE